MVQSSDNSTAAAASSATTSVSPYHVSLYRNDGSLRYSGQMVQHQKEGWGTEFCSRGNVTYVGNWHLGKRHGHGTFTKFSPDSNRLLKRYTGEFKNGQRNGYGVQETFKKCRQTEKWQTIVHDGYWKDDNFHGWGRLLEFCELDELLGLASGVESNLRYEGTWLDNLRDGVGLAIYPNGDRFEGIWRRDQRNGRGRYWFASDRRRCLRGVWIDDTFKSGTLLIEPSENANVKS